MLSTSKVGYGHARIVSKEGNHLLLRLRTPTEAHIALPKGAHLWFVGKVEPAFSGLWIARVIGQRIFEGQTTLEVTSPKFEPKKQQRRSRRATLDALVKVRLNSGEEIPYELRSDNLSETGIGLTADRKDISLFRLGTELNLVIKNEPGNIEAKATVVHTSYNWLSNRSSIGLEFTELSPDASRLLNDLLAVLAGVQGGRELDNVPQDNSLSQSIKPDRRETKLIRRAQEVENREKGESNGTHP